MEGIDAKQIGRDCLPLMEKKMSRQITPEEYYLALMKLHEKYPLKGHWPPLGKEAMEDYKNRDLEPYNFKEAADMYMFNKQRMENTKEDVLAIEEVPF